MSMDYTTIQNEVIQKYNIKIETDSKCWKRTHAHIDGSRRVCKWNQANSYASTFTLFHEIGHIETHKKSYKRYEQEYYATTWGTDKMKEAGLPIKRKKVQKYKDYIRRTYERGIRRGLETTNTEIVRYLSA